MTLDETRITAAADFMAQARLSGRPTPAPPAHLTPRTEAEGYAIQTALHGLLQEAGHGRPAGHKIGCTTPVMQAFLDIDHPCAGEVFGSMTFHESVELPLSRFHRIGVECEIAARLGADLLAERAPYSRDAVGEAVSALMGAIELVDDRYEDYSVLSAPVLIGDDFFNAGVVLGAEQTDWRDLDLKAIRGTLWDRWRGARVGSRRRHSRRPARSLGVACQPPGRYGQALACRNLRHAGECGSDGVLRYAGIGHGGLDRSQSGQSAVHLKMGGLADRTGRHRKGG